MIKIRKSKQSPSILTGIRASASIQNIEVKLRSGTNPKSIVFDTLIYNGRSVKEQLREDQHQKCAYCECDLTGDYGAVEHYRPKKGWQETHHDTLHEPGYYWLAYEWNNLLCSCDKCNNRAYKGTLFPLRDPNARDIQNKNISREIPLIINPSIEDPGQFIRFNKYIAVPKTIDGEESDKGKTTIDIFDLNGRNERNTKSSRADLLNERKTRWDEAKALYDAYISNGHDSSYARSIVKRIYADPKKRFAGMFENQDMWF